MIQRRAKLFPLVFALCACIGPRAQDLTAGLVAHYPLDGNANDTSTNGVHGTAYAITPALDRFGNPNGAVAFDGVQSYIDCGTRSVFDLYGDFTITAWVKTSGDQSNKYILGRYNLGSYHGFGLGLTAGSVPYAFTQDGSLSVHDCSGGPSLNDGQWHFLVFTHQYSGGATLYRDNVRVGAGLGAPWGFADPAPVMIGRIAKPGHEFEGLIDDVRFYNRVLTTAERAQLGPPVDFRITRQPKNLVGGVGSTARLAVEAIAANTSDPITYQWFKNGSVMTNFTTASIGVRLTELGDTVYKARVRVGSLELFSHEARITVARPAEARLLAHYTFDNDEGSSVTDSAGGFHGQAINAERVPGLVGSGALRFNGSNSVVRIHQPDSPLHLGGAMYTLAFWVRRDSSNGSQTALWLGDGSSDGYYFSAAPGYFWLHSSGVEPSFEQGKIPPSTNWLHFALVYDGLYRSIYMNGNLSNRVSTFGPMVSDPAAELFLGARFGTNNFLRGVMDDLRIYNYPLAAEEIRDLAEAAPEPQLTVERRGFDVLITWPDDPACEYRVEWRLADNAVGAWAPAAGLPTRSAGICSLTQPFPQEVRTYRLRKL